MVLPGKPMRSIRAWVIPGAIAAVRRLRGATMLVALKGRWVIENAFKYLDYYGIDWLVDYHAEITVNTKLVDNPARKQANAAIRAAKTAHADAQRALGQLLTDPPTQPPRTPPSRPPRPRSPRPRPGSKT